MDFTKIISLYKGKGFDPFQLLYSEGPQKPLAYARMRPESLGRPRSFLHMWKLFKV
jgi:hypothetical protein